MPKVKVEELKTGLYVTADEPLQCVYNHTTVPDKFVVEKSVKYRDGVNLVTLRDIETYKQRNFYLKAEQELDIILGHAKGVITKQLAKAKKSNFVHDVSCTFGQLGADPELFVEDGDGKLLPAFKFLGSKSNPTIGPSFVEAYGMDVGRRNIYWDGFQCEFDVYPEGCLSHVIDSIRAGLLGTQIAAREVCPKAKLSIQSVYPIAQQILEEEDEKFVQFGCNPSLNVYGLSGKREDGRLVPFRAAGGHIHLGIGHKDPEVVTRIIKGLDAIVGVMCVSLFASFDSPVRREYYGLPGEYRKPAHGLEYRTLSNGWLSHPTITNMTFDLTRFVTKIGICNKLADAWDFNEKEVIETILSCDVKQARKIMTKNKGAIIAIFNRVYGRGGEVAYKIFMNGMESAIKDPTDIEKNWRLDKPDVWQKHNETFKTKWGNSRETLEKGEKI